MHALNCTDQKLYALKAITDVVVHIFVVVSSLFGLGKLRWTKYIPEMETM